MKQLALENKLALPAEAVEQCPITATMSVIGGKWKPAILYALRREETLRFGELRRAIPDVTQKMLTQQLREMEADGLIVREVFAEVPPRVEYTRTPYGKTLDGIMVAMAEWGETHRRQAGARIED